MAKKTAPKKTAPKHTTRKVTPPKVKAPLYAIVSVCVVVPQDNAESIRKIREGVVAALSTPKALKSLRVNWDKRMGRGGVSIDEPFHQKD